MKVIASVLQFLGSIGLFIYGMRLLSGGLQKVAGKKMENILHLMTKHRITGVLTGLVITAFVQSSSATTVMVVGFSNAGFITLPQAISVIMGANIGTTVSAWIVSIFGVKFDLTLCAFLLLFISFPLLFAKKDKLLNLTDVFVGLGLLFLGMYFIQGAIPSPDTNVDFFSFTRRIGEPTVINMILCTLIGFALTAIIQSSAATMTLTIMLAFNGWIGPYAAASLCLGQNIGTTVTAMLSSIGTNVNAKRAAMAHMLFNVIGSVIALIFLKPLMILVNFITPGNIFTESGVSLAHNLPFFLSMFHTVFNLLNTVIFFPFVNQLSRLIEQMIPEKESDAGHKKYAFSISSAISYSQAPELYLGAVKDEVWHLSEVALKMLESFKSSLFLHGDELKSLVQKMKDDENYADEMQEVLTSICVDLMKQSPSSSIVNNLTGYIRGIDELESITDSCYTLVCDAEKRSREGYVFSSEAESRIVYYIDMVTSYLEFISVHIKTNVKEMDLMKSYEFENRINKERSNLVSYVEKRMKETSENIQKELLLFDMTRQLEHIGDFCTNIAQTYAKLSK